MDATKATAATHRILLLPEGFELSVADGALLLDVLRAHVAIDAPCGGNGTCGKCLADVTVGGRTERLRACQTRVHSDMTVTRAPASSIEVLKQSALEQPDTPMISNDGITPGGQTPLFAACDVGTTTLVCSLLDPLSGRELAVRGAKNPQWAFGADVMARLLYASGHGNGALQDAVVSGLNELIASACAQAGVSPAQIGKIVAVGNSAMQALLLGRSPASLMRPPYAPESRDTFTSSAAALGLAAGPAAEFLFLPLIGGFVGADTTACLLATEFDARPGNRLLVDVGTNGEIVLSNGKRRIACSTAAGPAFEGALLHSGMRAAAGAVDRAWFADGALHCSVIGGGAPQGICGSGLIALTAALLEAGALEASGRLISHGTLGDRVVPYGGQTAFVVSEAASSASGEPVLLTQKDVRGLQLAKGAICAGITLMADALSVPLDAIGSVALAGAFGSALDIPSAVAIGLIPAALAPRVRSVGNAALAGAKLAALYPGALRRAETLAEHTEHIALSANPAFEERFVSALALRPVLPGGGA